MISEVVLTVIRQRVRNAEYTCENDVKRSVANIYGVFGDSLKWYSAAQGTYSEGGISDKIGCLNGYFIANECKYGKNKLSVLQWQFLMDVRSAGGLALVTSEKNINNLLDVLLTVYNLPPSGGANNIFGPCSLTDYARVTDEIEEYKPSELGKYVV